MRKDVHDDGAMFAALVFVAIVVIVALSGCGTQPKVSPYVDGDAGKSLYLGVKLEWQL